MTEKYKCLSTELGAAVRAALGTKTDAPVKVERFPDLKRIEVTGNNPAGAIVDGKRESVFAMAAVTYFSPTEVTVGSTKLTLFSNEHMTAGVTVGAGDNRASLVISEFDGQKNSDATGPAGPAFEATSRGARLYDATKVAMTKCRHQSP